MDVLVVLVYLVSMIAFGFWGRRRAQSQSDFLVAGRRLGPMLYSGTMAAVVLGGASTIGGVGLGYQYGLSGHVAGLRHRRGHPAALASRSRAGSSGCASTPWARCWSCATAPAPACSPAW